MPLFLVLLGEFTYNNPEKIRCQRTLELLREHKVRYEAIIGTNPEEKSARKLLFKLAGIGNQHYPQFFFEDDDGDVIYLGDIYFLEAMAKCNSIPGAGEEVDVEDDYIEEETVQADDDDTGIDGTLHSYVTIESNDHEPEPVLPRAKQLPDPKQKPSLLPKRWNRQTNTLSSSTSYISPNKTPKISSLSSTKTYNNQNQTNGGNNNRTALSLPTAPDLTAITTQNLYSPTVKTTGVADNFAVSVTDTVASSQETVTVRENIKVKTNDNKIRKQETEFTKSPTSRSIDRSQQEGKQLQIEQQEETHRSEKATAPVGPSTRSLRPGMVRGNSMEIIKDIEKNIGPDPNQQQQTSDSSNNNVKKQDDNHKTIQETERRHLVVSSNTRSPRSMRPGMIRGNSMDRIQSVNSKDDNNNSQEISDSSSVLHSDQDRNSKHETTKTVEAQKNERQVHRHTKSGRSLRPGVIRGNSIDRLDKEDDTQLQSNHPVRQDQHQPSKKATAQPSRSLRPGLVRGNSIDRVENDNNALMHDQQGKEQDHDSSNILVSNKYIKRSLRPGLIRGNTFDNDDTSKDHATQPTEAENDSNNKVSENDHHIPEKSPIHKKTSSSSLRPMAIRGNSFDSDDHPATGSDHNQQVVSDTGSIFTDHRQMDSDDNQHNNDDDDDDDSSSMSFIRTTPYKSNLVAASVKRSLRPGMVRGNSFEELLSKTLQSERNSLHVHSNHMCRPYNKGGESDTGDDSSTSSDDSSTLFEKHSSVRDQYKPYSAGATISFMKPYAIKGSTLRNVSNSLSQSQHGSIHH